MVAKATRLRSSRPPTELADGFGPEESPTRDASPNARAIHPRGSMGPRSARPSGGAVRRGPVDAPGFKGWSRPDRGRSYPWNRDMSQPDNKAHVRSQAVVDPVTPDARCGRATPLQGGVRVWQAVRVGAVAQLVRAWDS